MPINKDSINVLNYNENPVCVTSHLRGYYFPAAEGGQPSLIPMTLAEIETISANSGAFRLGLLRFPKEMEAELYSLLKIADWENIPTNRDIEDILLHPTLDGLKRLIAIKNPGMFERVRGVYFALKNADADISTRVEKVIKTRYRELCSKQYQTAIVLTPRDSALPGDEAAELRAQNEAMLKQLADMQAKLDEMAANAAVKPEVAKPEKAASGKAAQTKAAADSKAPAAQ